MAVSEAFLNAYANTTRQAAEQSLKSLDASINWALTLTLGILAFVINAVVVKGPLTDAGNLGLLLAALSTGFSMLVHFGIRAAKNYLNIVRFAKLEREAIRCNLGLQDGSDTLLQHAVTTYHIEWKSPLGRLSIFRKVLLEFGFLYLLAVVTFVFWFLARELPAHLAWIWMTALFASGISIAGEILIFAQSPYISNPVPDFDVQKKA